MRASINDYDDVFRTKHERRMAIAEINEIEMETAEERKTANTKTNV